MNSQLAEALKALEEQKKMTRKVQRQLDRALENNVNLCHENKQLREVITKRKAA